MPEEDAIARLYARLEKLEEGHAFAERAAEGLSAEVYGLGKRVEELAKRVGRLERLVENASEETQDEAGAPGVSPPDGSGYL